MNLTSAAAILAAVRRVTGPGKIGMHEPDIGFMETDAVERCVNGGAVDYGYIDRFQEHIAAVCVTEQALAVSSGTAALHLALMVCGVSRFDEVIMPALTFIATANAVRYCGATPNFVDSRESDLGIDPDKLRAYLDRIADRRQTGTFNRITGKRIKAIAAVHLLGNPCDMDAIMQIAATYDLPVIEDAAEALGSKYKGRPCGGLGHVGAVSFNNNKIVTTNGGGALLTNDPFLQAEAWNLATTARLPHPWLMEHDRVAYNYRMGNINAALGYPQLVRLADIVGAKQRLHTAYCDELGDLMFKRASSQVMPNYWLNAIMLPPEQPEQRDAICQALTDDGLACRALFTPLHRLPRVFAGSPRDDLSCAESLFARTICLPSSPKLA